MALRVQSFKAKKIHASGGMFSSSRRTSFFSGVAFSALLIAGVVSAYPVQAQSVGGAGGFGDTESGGKGGDANQNGSDTLFALGGAAGVAPGGDGANGGVGGSFCGTSECFGSGAGAGGGGGADGSLASPVGGKGGNGGDGFANSEDSFGVYGGGGGGGGGAGLVTASTLTNGGTIQGGAGGAGGAGAIGFSAATVANGGVGGGGGDGLIVTGSGVTVTNNGAIAGGVGGAGGATAIPDGGVGSGAVGGAGGYGVAVTGSGVTVINNGSIVGGDGGAGGATIGTRLFGAQGAGGIGVIGANLTVINAGSIAGGVGGSGQADAVHFTGGTNVFEIRGGSSVTGNVVGAGSDTLRFGGSTNSSFDISTIGSKATYQGFTQLEKTGASTWNLVGSNTDKLSTTVSQGQLDVSGSLGSATSLTGPITILSGATFNVAAGGKVYASGVNNAGFLTVAATGFLQDDLTNTGHVTNNGVFNAIVASNSGTIDNNSVWNGDVQSNTGTINNSQFWNGSINNAGTLNSTGTISGVLTNFGVINGQGALGSVVNAPSGVINVNANSGLTVASLQNSGVINLQQGGSVTNFLQVNGGYVGGGALLVNSQINGASSGQLRISGGASGTTIVSINPVGPSQFHPDNLVISNGSGGTFISSTSLPTTTPSPFAIAGGQLISSGSGLVQQWFGQASPGNYVVRSSVNSVAIGGLMGAMTGMLSTFNTIFLEPDSAFAFSEASSGFVTGPANPDPNTFKLGVWTRGRVADFTTTLPSAISTTGQQPVFVSNQSHSTLQGIQFGVDMGAYNIENTHWNANFGVHGGTVGGNVTTLGDSLSVSMPFVGVYGVLSNGAFSIDALVQHNFYNLGVSAFDSAGNNLIALGGNSERGNGWSGIINSQYHYNIPQTTWFIEPSLAFLFSDASIDPLQVNLAQNSGTPIVWNAFESRVGRAGLRFGYWAKAADWLIVSPYASLSVWHEFAGNAGSSLAVGPNTNVFASTDNVGTFGQASLGVALSSPVPGFTGFLRGDTRFGEHISGGALTGGLRYLF